MKKIILLLWFTFGIIYVAKAQISLVPANVAKYLPGEDAIVKDTSGRQYSYNDWTFLIASGKFSLHGKGKRDENGKYSSYVLHSLFDANGEYIVTKAMKRNKPAESEQFKTGDVFSPFKEKAMDGEKFDLRKPTGKVYVINFWFIGCPPCRAEIPDLNKLVEHYKDNKDVVFIAICLDEGYAIKDFIKTNPFNYHIIDDGRYLASKYGVHLFPTHVVVNKQGKVAYSCVSNPVSNQYWITKTVDEALLANVTPLPVN